MKKLLICKETNILKYNKTIIIENNEVVYKLIIKKGDCIVNMLFIKYFLKPFFHKFHQTLSFYKIILNWMYLDMFSARQER